MDNLILRDVVDSIQTRQYVLPVIQRDFIWEPEKICLLFDSILRKYSIGLFLFWKLNDERRSSYEVYSFQDNYVEGSKQDPLCLPLPKLSQYAILDGQQRLTSVCLALKGSYTYANKANSTPKKRKFYMNLLYSADNEENESNIKYEFKFLAEDELSNNENQYWYLVNNILKWKNKDDAEDVYNKICQEDYLDINTEEELIKQKNNVIDNLITLYNYVCCEKIIQVFCIEDDVSENEVLDIFVRVNSQGKPLSRTDFIFSRIVALWRDARQTLEDFQKKKLIDKFGVFDKDLIMRICLAIVNKSTVSRLSTDKFNKQTVIKIKESWQKISNSIEETAVILSKLGYCTDTIISTNALIPIVCFLYNDGNGKDDANIDDIRRYLSIISIKHIFSGQTLGRLNKILKVLNDNASRLRPFERVLAMSEFQVNENDIEDALSATKGKKDAFAILSLLYSYKNYDDNYYNQDHMHPWALISKKSTYTEHNVSTDKMAEWKKKADTLPNLQILEESENKSKGGKPFSKWVKQKYADSKARESYFKLAYLPENISLEFEDFETFYSQRKENMKKALAQKLNINLSNNEQNNERKINDN